MGVNMTTNYERINNDHREWDKNCEFYKWEMEYPYFIEYCGHYNEFVKRRKKCEGCKGKKAESEE